MDEGIGYIGKRGIKSTLMEDDEDGAFWELSEL